MLFRATWRCLLATSYHDAVVARPNTATASSSRRKGTRLKLAERDTDSGEGREANAQLKPHSRPGGGVALAASAADTSWAKEILSTTGTGSKGRSSPEERVLSTAGGVGGQRTKQFAKQDAKLKQMASALAEKGNESEAAEDPWMQRRAVFTAVQNKFWIALRSHRTLNDKCHVLLQLHSKLVEPLKVRLRNECYEDIFHAFAAAADARQADVMNRANADIDGSAPVSAQKILKNAGQHRYSLRQIQQVWALYDFMKEIGTKPTLPIVHHLMYLLATVPQREPTIEAKAHALMFDVARCDLDLDPRMLRLYYQICGTNNVMHLAIASYADFQNRVGDQPTPDMTRAILRGLIMNNQLEEGLQFAKNAHHVPVDIGLIHAYMRLFRAVGDPMACVSLYRSFFPRSNLTPLTTTFAHLLLACKEAQDYSNLLFLVKEMGRYGVSLTATNARRVLEGLRASGRMDLYEHLRAKLSDRTKHSSRRRAKEFGEKKQKYGEDGTHRRDSN